MKPPTHAVILSLAALSPAHAGQPLTYKVEQFQCVPWKTDNAHLERCIIKVKSALPESDTWSRAACYGEIEFQTEQGDDVKFNQGFVLSLERPKNGHLPEITFMNSFRLGAATDVKEARLNWSSCNVVE